MAGCGNENVKLAADKTELQSHGAVGAASGSVFTAYPLIFAAYCLNHGASGLSMLYCKQEKE